MIFYIMPEKKSIAIQKIVDDDVKSAIFASLDLINAKKIMKENMTIILKPNILGAKPPERAVTTHPEVLRGVIHWLKQFNPKEIIVAESSGGQKPGTTENAMKKCLISQTCEDEDVKCIPFEKTERIIYQVENPLVMTEFSSSHLLKDADLIINLPKIKTHGQCTLTCCIKNMFGTVLLGNKPKTHARFPTVGKFMAALTDIYSVSQPQLTIIDGYLCQEGNGPAGGDVVKLDLIIAGYDPVALERVVCEIIDFNYQDIKYIGYAEEKNLGSTKLENIELLGETIEDVKRPFKPPKSRPVSVPLPQWLADYAGKAIFRAEVDFDPEKCRLCSTCWSNCPTQAITPPDKMEKGNIPSWDNEKCITCYCCAELCPYEAVDFKINYVKNVLFSWCGVFLIALLLFIILLIAL
ncbi:MAG: DUF362 domain-containing protein [Candidatus Lokiarchaeota archaeon]|nr:DUF362 domain-containing protein [Candidatus Lokiarchaeota archaeon]